VKLPCSGYLGEVRRKNPVTRHERSENAMGLQSKVFEPAGNQEQSSIT